MNHSLEVGSIERLTLGELLDRLGSSDPAPGGGAAAAVVGALGAALVQMTANLTIGRPKLVHVEEHARAVEVRAAGMRRRLTELADADVQAFEQVSAAYKLPRQDDSQKAARSAAVQSALAVAADVPLETARVCAELLELTEEAVPILNRAVISDVLVGALLARAALEAAALNVEVNTVAMTDPTHAQRYLADLERARGGTAQRVERVLHVGRSRVNNQLP